MKNIITTLLTVASVTLVSCKNQAENPYGAPAIDDANPYDLAQDSSSSYTQEAPYQQLPGVGNSLPPTQAPAAYTPPAPDYTPSVRDSAPTAGSTIPHTVVKGDTLWKLSRDYNTTVDAIRSANKLKNDNIILGQTIQIPNN